MHFCTQKVVGNKLKEMDGVPFVCECPTQSLIIKLYENEGGHVSYEENSAQVCTYFYSKL